MPAIWTSSERPISVRTVWVNGARHVILSQDDPLISSKSSSLVRQQRRRHHQSTTSPKVTTLEIKSVLSALPVTNASFDGCPLELYLAVGKSSSRRRSAPVKSTNVSSNNDTTQKLFYGDASRDLALREALILERKATSSDKVIVASDECADVDSRDRAASYLERGDDGDWYLCNYQLDALSERVLRWLDLSGRSSQVPKLRELQVDRHELDERIPSEYQQRPSAHVISAAVTTLGAGQELSNERSDGKTMVSRLWSVARKAAVKINVQLQDQGKIARRAIFKAKTGYNADRDTWSSPSLSSSASWTLPRKSQLHVFMPSLKSTDVYWMSSQESVCCE